MSLITAYCGGNKFTLDNSNHVLSAYKDGKKKNSVLASEILNFEFSIDEYML